MPYEITALPSSKDNIRQPRAALAEVIPRCGHNAYIVGASGSGKSNLMSQLLINPEFYGTNPHAFDRVISLSTTAVSDDIQKALLEAPHVPLVEEDIITDVSKMESFLTDLAASQRSIIEESGSDKAPRICLVMDDLASERQFMSSTIFKKMYISSRHYGVTVFFLSQSYTMLPRGCRIQSNWVMFFSSGRNELEKLAEELASPLLTRKQMQSLVAFATEEKYSFLTFTRTVEQRRRYRRNLSEIIDLASVR